jgi:hypothetical protein
MDVRLLVDTEYKEARRLRVNRYRPAEITLRIRQDF